MMNNICFGILTCPANKKRFDKFMYIHEKWFIENGFTYYAIYGDPSLFGKGIDYRIKDNEFYCASNEAYEVLAHKLAIFYTYIFEKTSFDYVFKVDDGCLINKNNVLQGLNMTPLMDYCGGLMSPTSNCCHKGKCTNKALNKISLDFTHDFNKIKNIDQSKLKEIKHITYCGGGYGYGMSRYALKHIPKYKYHILSLNLSYEDVLFGQIMYLENIKPVYAEIGGYHCIKE